MATEKKRPQGRTVPESGAAGGERLHKFLASTGAGSRRECETFIKQGRVTVNGKLVTKMGVKVVPGTDVVTFDGEKVAAERRVYFLLNKPSGYICTNSDELGRPRAMDLVPDKRQRIYTVGRLDADSRGLILLTNDGTIANIICHPRYRVEKVYVIAVRGKVTRQQIGKLEAGVWLAEGKSSPASVRRMQYDPKRDESYLEMTLFEGRNREIRRVFAKVGMKVRRLVRTRIGPLVLGDLAAGACRTLAPADLRFVQEAERMHEANRELWDAELPRQSTGRPRGRGPSQSGFKGRPSKGGPNQGHRRGGSARPSQGRPNQGRPSQGRPSQGRPSQGGNGRGAGPRRPQRGTSGPNRTSGPREGGAGGKRPERRGRRYYP